MTPHAVEAATNQVMQKLQASLTQTLGFAGAGALAARALKLAQREYAEFDAVTIDPDAIVLTGLTDVFADKADGAAVRIAALIPTHFMLLLINLIGADIALIPVKNMWPAAWEDESFSTASMARTETSQ